MAISTPTQHILLGLLDVAPRHGYDIKREYDQRFSGLRPLRFSQIYSTLARLDRDGLVTLVEESSEQGPDRKQYAITESGVGDLESWFDTPLPPDEPPQGELFLKVTLALLSGRDAAQLITAQRAVHMDHMRQLRSDKRSATSEADRVLADYAIFHLDADIKWMEHTEKRLARLAEEVTSS